jgi:endonuclease/exonuclease/phosphatase family metal-dependent hydrolase
MRSFRLACCSVLSALLLAGCVRVAVHGDPDAWAEGMGMGPNLRVATYNTSLYDDAEGGLVARLEAGDAGAARIAAVLQRVRPDVVLLNEFDYDAGHRAADLFQQRYVEIPQPGGGAPLHYPYRYLAQVNTGVPSGLDISGDGQVGSQGRARGDDAWGYGLHPGQYGMLVLSRHPIDVAAVRTFALLKWHALPGAARPVDPATDKPFHPEAIWRQLRLSSKSHWDVPIRTPLGVVHLLAAHPTPPVFDGPEDRNGARNFDEIGLWARYLSDTRAPWLCDDQGRCGGLPGDAHFIIAGDLNADPVDGAGRPGAIAQLLAHPRIDATFVPKSLGAPERAGERALPRRGDVAAHTGDFGRSAGTLRLDYLLPSRTLRVADGGVFWPPRASAEAAIADGSDHYLVWVDLRER